MVATLIGPRLLSIGFSIEPETDPAAFFEPFAEIIEHAIKKRDHISPLH